MSHLLPGFLRPNLLSVAELAEFISETNGVETFATRWGCFSVPKPGQEVLGWLLHDIFLDAEYENQIVRLEPGDVVIDCGAHVGVFARFALQRGASRVICVEIDDSNFQCLQTNLQDARENVQMYHAALWHRQALLPFLRSTYSDCHRVSSEGDASIKKEAISLDELVGQIAPSRVDFIKVDVEGAEPEVLMGALKIIQRYKPKLALALYHDPLEERRVRHLFQGFPVPYKFSYRRLVGSHPYILFGRPAS